VVEARLLAEPAEALGHQHGDGGVVGDEVEAVLRGRRLGRLERLRSPVLDAWRGRR
jgi:hypothetical protein